MGGAHERRTRTIPMVEIDGPSVGSCLDSPHPTAGVRRSSDPSVERLAGNCGFDNAIASANYAGSKLQRT